MSKEQENEAVLCFGQWERLRMYFNGVLLALTVLYYFVASPDLHWWDIIAAIAIILLINFLYLTGFVIEMADLLLFKTRFGISKIRIVIWSLILAFTSLLTIWLIHLYYFSIDHALIAAFDPFSYIPDNWWPL